MRVLALAVLMLALGAGLARADDKAALVDQLTEKFRVTVFANELGEFEVDRITKWTTPLRYRVVGGEEWIDEIRLNLQVLFHYTRIKMEIAEPANVVVHFVRREEFLGVFRRHWDPAMPMHVVEGASCMAAHYIDKDHTIDEAIVVVDRFIWAPFIKGCLIEEMTQIMGISGDTDLSSVTATTSSASLSTTDSS